MKWNTFPAVLLWIALITVITILMQYLPGSAWAENGPPERVQWVRTFLLPFAGGIVIYYIAWWFKTSLDARDEQKRK